MFYKCNFICLERLIGMVRIVCSYVVVVLENVVFWYEWDIFYSLVERVILLDVCILIYFMFKEIIELVKKLLVYLENMKWNMNVYGGVIFS